MRVQIWKTIGVVCAAVAISLGGVSSATAATGGTAPTSGMDGQSDVVSSQGPTSALILGYQTCDFAAMYSSGSAWTHIPTRGSHYVADCVLAWGSNNYGVRVLQQALNQCYGQGIAEDSIFGGGTESALMNVQSWVGVDADGVFGPATRNAMLWPTHDAGLGCRSVGWITSNFQMYYD